MSWGLPGWGERIFPICANARQTLAGSEIHLWLLPLVLPAEDRRNYADFLSTEERQRAARYRTETLRHEFECCRGMLRYVLGAYLQVEPGAVTFDYGPAGKPFLSRSPGLSCLEFNLSHSGSWTLIGLTRSGRIGVDLEAVRDFSDFLDIADGNFAPNEVVQLLGLPCSDQIEAFFAQWTRKESVVKAQGDGLTLSLKSFEVLLNTDGVAQFHPVFSSNEALRRWQVHGFKPMDGFQAAVAVDFVDPILRVFKPVVAS